MVAVNYLWNPINDNIVREFDDSGTAVAEYTTEPGYHGAVISEHRNGVSRFHIRDGDGNTVALTDEQGNVTDTFAYTAGGEVTERTGTTPTPYQYKSEHGYYTDQTTGHIMARRRDYDPPQGRWLSADPSGFVNGITLYQYVGNNPIGRVDPSGLQWTVRIGNVDFKDRCSLSYQAEYEFSIWNKDIPKPPLPAQVWAVNRTTIFSFDKDCKWQQQTFEPYDVDLGTGRITPLPPRKESWQVDVWGKSIRWDKDGWYVDDTSTSLAAGTDIPSKHCLVIIRTEKRIGFNSVREGKNYLLPEKTGVPIDFFTKEQQAEIQKMRRPFGDFGETYYLFSKKNCGCCLTQYIPAWLWSLVPDCIECLVYDFPLVDPVTGAPRDNYICQPRGVNPPLGGYLPIPPPPPDSKKPM